MFLVVTIFSFALMALYSIMLISNRSYFVDANYVELEQQARNSLDRMMREVRGAIKSSISITTVSATSDRLTFSKSGQSGIEYYLSGNQLIREYSGTAKVVANNIGYLKFSLSGSLLTINLKAEKNFFQLLSTPYKVQVRLRSG